MSGCASRHNTEDMLKFLKLTVSGTIIQLFSVTNSDKINNFENELNDDFQRRSKGHT